MAQIISTSRRVTDVTYARCFRWNDSPSAGFSFPCNAVGTIEQLHPVAQENLEKCLDGTYAVTDLGIQEYVNRYTVPAVLKCDCGAQVQLDGFTNTCDRCRADYNMSGQRLADRSQWGEETGESLGDILRIP